MLTIKDEFLCAAEWRRQKAVEYPHDKRNLEAAEILERLAASADQIEPQLLSVYEDMWVDFRAAEVQTEMLRQVGLYFWPDNATEFLREFLTKCWVAVDTPTAGNA
jgi:hypothetical protein